MFQKSLADLIRGIRNHKKDESEFISLCLREIKEEVKSPDGQKKMVAIQKLFYVICDKIITYPY
jgi:AP-3 complex subunit delta